MIPGGIPTPQTFNGSYYTGTCVSRTASQPFVPNGPHCWLGTESRENPYWGTMTLEGTYANSKYNAGEIEIPSACQKVSNSRIVSRGPKIWFLLEKANTITKTLVSRPLRLIRPIQGGTMP